jgi:DNA-directed RNA polymerase
MFYKKSKITKYEINSKSFKRVVSYKTYVDCVDSKKQKNSAIANFIHSIDGSMMRTVIRGMSLTTDSIVPIHDC